MVVVDTEVNQDAMTSTTGLPIAEAEAEEDLVNVQGALLVAIANR